MTFSMQLLYIIFTSLLKSCVGQTNPCPYVFQYYNDGSQTIGVVKVNNLQSSYQELNVQFSIGTQIVSSYVGEIKPTTTDLNKEYKRTGYLTFKIYFPVSNPLPAITLISVNGREICSGPPVVSSYSTSLSLNYIFYLNDNPLSNSQSSNIYQNIFQQNNSPNLNGNFPNNNWQNTNQQINFQNLNGNSQNSNSNFQAVNGNLQPSNGNNLQFQNGYHGNDLQNLFQEDNNQVTTEDNNLANQNSVQQQQVNFSPQSWNSPVSNDQLQTSNINTNYEQAVTTAISTTTSQPLSNSGKKRKIASICGTNGKITNLIVEGMKTKRGDYPWHAAIYKVKDEGISFVCGGSLVSDQHVVTAAHCLNNGIVYSKKLKYLVFVGKQELHKYNERGAQVRENSNSSRNGLLVHEDYVQGQPEADIAIIILDEAVKFNNFVHPICLYSRSIVADITGKTATVVGWGRDGKGNAVSNDLQELQIRVIDSKICRQSDKIYQELLTEKTFCAEGVKKGSSPCNGDSGGGVALRVKDRWFLRGIVSTSLIFNATHPYCNPEKYFVLVDTLKYYQWIVDNVFFNKFE